MKVTIRTRRVYYKVAEVEIDIPNIDKYDIQQYLNDNEALWLDKIEDNLGDATLDMGLGMDEGNWIDLEEGEEWRYEVGNFGGHL